MKIRLSDEFNFEAFNEKLITTQNDKLSCAEKTNLKELVSKLTAKGYLGAANSSRLHFLVTKLNDSRISLIPTDKPFEFLIHIDAKESNLQSLESTALHTAVSEGNIETVKALLIEGKIDVNARDPMGRSPLQLAIIHNHPDIFKTLIEQPGVDINLTDKDGWTPTYRAVVLKDKSMLFKLVEMGAHLNQRNSDLSTPLHRASDNGEVEAVEFLLEHGAKPDMINSFGTALSYASGKGLSKVVELLLKHGANPNISKEPLGQTPLWLANNAGHEQTADRLRSAGGLEKVELREGSSELHRRLFGDPKDFLLYIQDNVNLTDEYVLTAVHYWASSGNEEIGQHLLGLEGIDLDIPDTQGRTPLHYAVIEGNAEIVNELLKRGVAVSSKDKQGYFPLHWAAKYHQRVGIAEQLIQNGAEVSMMDNFGWTPFRKAAENNNVAMGTFLLKQNIDVNETTPDGLTALHRAAINGAQEFIEFLLNNGADPTLKDKQGRVALQCYKGENEEIIDLLK